MYSYACARKDKQLDELSQARSIDKALSSRIPMWTVDLSSRSPHHKKVHEEEITKVLKQGSYDVGASGKIHLIKTLNTTALSSLKPCKMPS